MTKIRSYFAGGIAVLSSMAAVGASAETIQAEGHFPANSDIGLGLELIAVDTIEGPVGAKVAFELKDALDGLRIGDEQWFEITRGDLETADAMFVGTADTSSSVTELDDKEVVSCAEKDSDDNCIRETTSYFSCRRYEASFFPDIELISANGDVIYSIRKEETASTDYCSDEETRPSVSDMSDDLMSSFAYRIRYMLAPRAVRSDYRLLEKRKGLEKPDRKLFKQGLKLTKTDEDAACDVFKGLEATNPQQSSVLFNVGLCHERAGDIALADELYRRASDADPGKWMIDEALERIGKKLEAEAQFAQRAEILQARYAQLETQDAAAETAEAQ
ncbi:MAG: hypothetical protein AAF250_12705 [Pseudomonadota bacterium]